MLVRKGMKSLTFWFETHHGANDFLLTNTGTNVQSYRHKRFSKNTVV